MKKNGLSFLSLLIFSLPLLAFPWEPITSRQPKPLCIKMEQNGPALLLSIRIPGFYKYWVEEKKGYWISVPGAQDNSAPSSPRLPFVSILLALKGPDLPGIEIECESKTTFSKMPIVVNGPENIADTPSDGKVLPEKLPIERSEWASLSVPYVIKSLGNAHGTHIVHLFLMPFHYDFTSQEVRVVDQFTVRLRLEEGTWEIKDHDLSFFPMKNAILNCDEREEKTGKEDIPDEYLIVTPSQFIPELQPLVAWRGAEGMLVTVKTLEEIKREMHLPGLLSADKLREFLGIYYARQPNLTYVLLVGDVEFIPAKYKNDDGTDFYYSLLDGTGDLLPDVYLGRFPVNNGAEVTAMVEKIIAYEKESPGKRVLLGSYFQDVELDGVSDRDYVYTSELFRSFLIKRQYVCQRVYTRTPGSTPRYYSDHTPVPPDLTFDGTTQEIVNFINTGAALINHRDHGEPEGWNHPSFRIEDLSRLDNRRYPILFNVDCETGKFDLETEKERRELESPDVSSDRESFSERLLCLKRRGMVAVIAPSRVTVNSLNDCFNKGLMEAIWPKMFDSCDSPATRLGQVLYRARIKLVREFCPNGWINDKILGNFHHYHLLGDPALHLKQPQ